jgi:uncharacterized protein involved in exopolysaccharide biosynthesis
MRDDERTAMSRNTHTTSLTALDTWSMLCRHRMRCVVAACAAAAITLAASFFLPRHYQAEAVFERRNDMVLTEITNTGASRSFQNPRQALVKELTGDTAIDTTVERVAAELATQGRHLSDFDRDRLRQDLRRRLHVSFDFATDPVDRVRLSFTGHDPLIAKLAVNTLVAHYIEQTRTQMDERLRESASFFNDEVARARAHIRELENKMLAFELEHAQLLPDSPGSLRGAVNDMQKLLVDARQQQEAARLRIEALRTQLDATATTTPTITRSKNPELTRLEERQRQLVEQRSRHLLVDRMKPEHPDLIALQRQIETMQEQIDQTEAEVVSATTYTDNPRHAEISLLLAQSETDHQALGGQIQVLEQELAEAAQRGEQMYPVRAEYKAITREVQQAQRQLHFWEDNLRRVQTTLSAEHGNRGVQLALIRPSGVPRRPVSPNFMQVLMAALMAGGAAGALAVFLAHRADGGSDDPDQLAQNLGLPLLGAVGPIVTAAQRRVQWMQAWIVRPVQIGAMACVVLALVGVAYVALERPDLWASVRDTSAQWTTTLGLTHTNR